MSFQSTRPSRDGTKKLSADLAPHSISIHPSLAGRDGELIARYIYFEISIHPSLAGRDEIGNAAWEAFKISIHPSLAGRDCAVSELREITAIISIHPSLAGRDLT